MEYKIILDKENKIIREIIALSNESLSAAVATVRIADYYLREFAISDLRQKIADGVAQAKAQKEVK